MTKYIKKVARVLLPENVRYNINSVIPKISTYETYIITRFTTIKELHDISDKYTIREFEEKDYQKLKEAYYTRSKNYFEKKIVPRLSNPLWVCLIVHDDNKNQIAYMSWIVTGKVEFIKDSRIKLKPNQFFLRDAYCVPDYRRQGLNTRMDQERINYCVSNGANEILFQIGAKAYKDQNIIKKTTDYCENDTEVKGLKFLKKNYIIRIPRFGIHNDLFSFFKNPFRKIS